MIYGYLSLFLVYSLEGEEIRALKLRELQPRILPEQSSLSIMDFPKIVFLNDTSVSAC